MTRGDFPWPLTDDDVLRMTLDHFNAAEIAHVGGMTVEQARWRLRLVCDVRGDGHFPPPPPSRLAA